ncbi:MAG: sialate O-acetylesterase [Bacteroidales bacterium]|jgi:sialate O-acetylesterase|nr:sialate O-acetylesterase [Bacteroidales bacterium]MCI1785120.1 sialate O-acetylesterase [Bacteroidales bacterium]
MNIKRKGNGIINYCRVLFMTAAAFVYASTCFQATAEIRLPDILGSGMVLQENATVNLWGTAEPGAIVMIRPSWQQEISVSAGKDGKWKTGIKTLEPSYKKYSITFREKGCKDIILKNILFGEVWLCSGQSNMEMPLNGFINCPVEESNEAIADAGNHPGIRFVTIPKTGYTTLQDTVGGKWVESNPDNAQWFGAAAYFFALRLNETLGIPVGIINCSWGGTSLEGWLPENIVGTYKDMDPGEKLAVTPDSPGKWDWTTPCVMYNGMLYPLRNYTVKGFVWYQGESNVSRYGNYAGRLYTLARLWRSDWKEGDIPFFIVELPPYSYGSDGTLGARLREAQHKAAETIPNSGLVCTNDLVYPYEKDQIHPCRKREVGDRIAFMVLNRTYGIKSIACEGPVYKSMSVMVNKSGKRSMEVFFRNSGNGFSPHTVLEGFEIAGKDKIFHPAKAKVDTGKESIIVWSDDVPYPVAVRYCFRDFQPGNLKGGRNLPAVPFRTDDW